jgi:hypothetical protein
VSANLLASKASGRLAASAGVKMIHCVGIKLIRLEEDGSFLAAGNVDSGGSGGNQGSAAQRDADTGDCATTKLIKLSVIASGLQPP